MKHLWVGRSMVAALAVVTLVPFVACGGSKPTTTTPPMGSSSAPPMMSAPPMNNGTGMNTAPPMNSAPPMASAPASAPPMASAPPAASSAPAAVPSAVVTALLSPLAAKLAPGMQPEGQPLVANLAEGQHTEMTVNMVAGKCYTIIGASPAAFGVKTLELNLLTPPFFTLSAGKSTSKTNEASIGSGSNPTCPITPFPVPYKIDVLAKSGTGPVGVQVYSKNK